MIKNDRYHQKMIGALHHDKDKSNNMTNMRKHETLTLPRIGLDTVEPPTPQAQVVIDDGEVVIDLRVIETPEIFDDGTTILRPAGNSLSEDLEALRALRQIVPARRL